MFVPCSRWSVCVCQSAAHTQLCRTVGLHRIHTVSGAALKEGQGNSICSWHLLTIINLVKTSFSLPSCTFEDDCQDSDWISIPDDSHQQKMVSYKVEKDGTGQVQITYKLLTIISCGCHLFLFSTLTSFLSQITFNIQTHLTGGQKALSNFACRFQSISSQLCSRASPPPQFPQCTCILDRTLTAEGQWLSEEFHSNPAHQPVF